MKYSRSAVHRRVHKIPALRFETQTLTSYSGLVLVQALLSRLRLKERLRACFDHLAVQSIFGHHVVMLVLFVHLLLGYRELRDSRFYRDDPLVKRVLGLHRLPDVATISRALASADPHSIAKLRRLSRQLVLERLQQLRPARLTLDFDGSVLSTQRAAEGSAVGFNKQKKGARSYYPLFCTVPQTGQLRVSPVSDGVAIAHGDGIRGVVQGRDRCPDGGVRFRDRGPLGPGRRKWARWPGQRFPEPVPDDGRDGGRWEPGGLATTGRVGSRPPIA
jgi:hypothetical protein